MDNPLLEALNGDRHDQSPNPDDDPSPPPAVFNINGGVSKSFSQNAESRQFNLKLIRMVRDRPELYDLKYPAYKSATERDRGWKEVAAELDQDVEFVRTRWKTMRDRFKKECRKFERHQTVTWSHFHEMAFLQPFFRFKSIVGVDPSELIDYGALAAGGALDSTVSDPTVCPPDSGPSYLDDGLVHNSGNFLMDLVNNSAMEQQQDHRHQVQQNDKNHTNGTMRQRELEEDNGDDEGDDEENGNGSDWAPGVTLTLEDFNRPTPANEQKRARTLRDALDTSLAGASKRFRAAAAGLGQPAQSNGSQPIQALSLNGSGPLRAGLGSDRDGDDEEDALFCRIMLKKLKRMDEATKEAAKAKILDLLVRLQYGESASLL